MATVNINKEEKNHVTSMLCQRCQKSLRSTEGIKCGECESRYHVRCVAGDTRDLELECGDRGFHWICATCQTPASKTNLKSFHHEQINQQVLLNAINAITEKFELVNKIQLPKLNNDLLQIKSVTDRIVKQNEDILVKIDELKRHRVDPSKCHTNGYRRRNLNISPRPNTNEEQTPILGGEKVVRYRTRRRSYPLLKMLLQLNRKLRRTPRRN